MRVLVLLALVSYAFGATFVIKVGATNSVSFAPTAVTIALGDTVIFQFLRSGDKVISSANLNAVCPDGVNPVAGACDVAANPSINITGPLSGFPAFNQSVVFGALGQYGVVNPTYCQTVPGFETVACSAKAVITVSQPAPVPTPGSTIIVIGQGGSQVAFPSPLTVSVGETVWFRFDILAGVTETDVNGVPVQGGNSCPIASAVGTFCFWNITSIRPYFYRATPFTFGGVINSLAPTPVPPGAFVINIGAGGAKSFSVPAGTVPVGTTVYFQFLSYGPFRVQRGDGPNCQPFVGIGSFDSGYEAAGRVFAAGITTVGVTYFFDSSFCASDGMRSSLIATSTGTGSDFVEVVVAPRNNITGVSELRFDPNPAVVFQFGSVRWTFTDFGHTVTQALNNNASLCMPLPGGFNSGFVQPPTNGIGGTFIQQFNTLGTFNYYCAAHCAQGMQGSVIVIPRPSNIITHGVNNVTNPNQFNPTRLVVTPGSTVCWDFVTAGNIVQSDYFQDCTATIGGFNSGVQSVGTRICRNFTGPSCTAFYYFDSTQCQNGMTGVVLVSDVPAVTVRNDPNVYLPSVLNVTVGSTVTWTFLAAGNSVTQGVALAQFSSPNQTVRCAVLPGGINSGVIQNAPATFSATFDAVQVLAIFSTPFCPFTQTFPNFFSSVNVCDPIVRRPNSTVPPTTTPSPCAPTDPCAKPPPHKTVINFFFADILAGSRCGGNCTAK